MPGMGRGTSRRLVEGKSATVVQYVQHHIVEIMENIGCFDPQHADFFDFQPRGSALVLRDLADVVMAAAIHFDSAGRKRNRSRAHKVRPGDGGGISGPLVAWVHIAIMRLPAVRAYAAARAPARPSSLSAASRSSPPPPRRSPSPSFDGEDLRGHAFSRRPSFLIFSCHTSGARRWTFWPSLSTATVTGMSCTSNS